MGQFPRHGLRLFASLFIILFIVSISTTALIVLIEPFRPMSIQPAQAAASALILYVKPGASGDCSSWSKACDLTTALQVATAGSEIWATKGIYKPVPSDSNTRSATFQLKDDVAIYGGFTGNEITREQRDFAANATVLSGDIDNNDTVDPNGIVITTTHMTGNNAYHVVTGSNVTTTAVLDGFTITAGNASGESPHDLGGGMHNVSGSPTLANIAFSGNYAAYSGGGMYNSTSNLVLNNTSFSNNAAAGGGGGMHNDTSNPTLINVVFENNLANVGGGVDNSNSSNPTLTNVTFSGNVANYDGGGMANSNSSNPTLTSVTFGGNVANYNGGGMANFYTSNPTLTSVSFNGNKAQDGGGMRNDTSNPILTNVTFSSNIASSDEEIPLGGGIFNNNSNPILANVTFVGNSAVLGGGMANWTSSPTLTNITLSGNVAQYGGGMANGQSSNPVLINTIFWENQASVAPHIYHDEGSKSIIHYSLIPDGCPASVTCDHLITANPLFVDTANGNLHLQGNSPAIDAGDNTAPGLNGIFTDLDGKSRFIDILATADTGNGTAPIIDLGAFEYDPRLLVNVHLEATLNPTQFGQIVTFTATVSTTTGTPTGSVTFYDGATILDSCDLNSSNRMATFTTAALAARTHIITARYHGDVNFASSTSNYISQVVAKAGTTTALEATSNSSRFGQTLTFHAIVAAASGVPTGSVTFYTGETPLGSSNLNNGTATLTTAALDVGDHTITARYNGNANLLPSTSNAVSQTVTSNSIYLPLALKNYITYFEGPREHEPNNSYQQANGPLHFGQEYYAYPNDAKDYFSFYLPNPGTITIKMNEPVAEGVQMLLYHQIPVTGSEVRRDYESPYEIEYNGAAGWYYVYIYITGGYNSNSTYILRVDSAANK